MSLVGTRSLGPWYRMGQSSALQLRQLHSKKLPPHLVCKITFERAVFCGSLISFITPPYSAAFGSTACLPCEQSISCSSQICCLIISFDSPHFLYCEKQWIITLWSPFPPSQWFYRPSSSLLSDISFGTEECCSIYLLSSCQTHSVPLMLFLYFFPNSSLSL